jgi:hypothetical protein
MPSREFAWIIPSNFRALGGHSIGQGNKEASRHRTSELNCSKKNKKEQFNWEFRISNLEFTPFLRRGEFDADAVEGPIFKVLNCNGSIAGETDLRQFPRFDLRIDFYKSLPDVAGKLIARVEGWIDDSGFSSPWVEAGLWAK